MVSVEIQKGRTSEGKNGAKFPRWGNFASLKALPWGSTECRDLLSYLNYLSITRLFTA
jgi:hypothetical protein